MVIISIFMWLLIQKCILRLKHLQKISSIMSTRLMQGLMQGLLSIFFIRLTLWFLLKVMYYKKRKYQTFWYYSRSLVYTTHLFYQLVVTLLYRDSLESGFRYI